VPDAARTVLRLAAGATMLACVCVAAHRTASDPTDGAVLALAVRTMAGTVQDCRTLSTEELAVLPRHMQRSEICEARAVPYRLELTIDGEPRLDRVYRAAGIHGDRPITVDERILLAAGRHALAIRFAPVQAEAGHDLPVFTFAETVDLETGRIRVAALEGTSGTFRIH
jgi:hypothetical protein